MVISCSVRCAICLMGTCVTSAQRRHDQSTRENWASLCVNNFFSLIFICRFCLHRLCRQLKTESPNNSIYFFFLSVSMAVRLLFIMARRAQQQSANERFMRAHTCYTRRQFVHSLVGWLVGSALVCLVGSPSSVYSSSSRCVAIFNSDKFVTRMCCVLQFNLMEI